jgi:sugar phosphate isomerase/epimerase
MTKPPAAVLFRALLILGLFLFRPGKSAEENGIKIGLQTWTCRHMEFDEVVDFAVKHHIKYLQMISKHIDPNGAPEETKRKKAVLDQHGLICYTFGVNRTSMDKEQNRKLFEFAKLMGIKMIVVEPKNMAEWDNLEALVKEYNIKLAIHNHGLASTYGNPETVKKVLDSRDKRIGVCLDVGHLTAAGFDAAKTFREYNGRVYDIHLKDKKTETVDGKKSESDVVNGTGDANYKGLFTELAKSHWSGVLAIETDSDTFAKDPAQYVDASMKFARESLR